MVVSEEFREALKAWVKERVGRQTELARAVGCAPSNISSLLNQPDDYKTSDLVMAICEYTGIPIPDVSALPEEEGDLLGRLRKLKLSDPATYDVIVALLRSKS
jgi:transcriptional regulator with XRE-family HTH domain